MGESGKDKTLRWMYLDGKSLKHRTGSGSFPICVPPIQVPEPKIQWLKYFPTDTQFLRHQPYLLHSISICFFSSLSSILGVVIFAYCIWMKVDPKFYEWLVQLQLPEFYIGVYILLLTSVIVIISSLVRCVFILSDNSSGLKIMLIVDLLVYLFFIIGSAVLLNYSTLNSPIQDKIKNSMLELISQPSNNPSNEVLRSIQESMGCCGANGANDYIVNKRFLFTECRDAVTGSAYLYGCSEKLTVFLGEKCGWLSGIAMLLCGLTVIKAVLTIILIRASGMEKRLILKS